MGKLPAAKEPSRGRGVYDRKYMPTDKLMKALVKSKPEPGLWLEDVPVPEIGINDVLIRVRKASICGTDIHILNWDDWAKRTIPVPMVVGHEFMGEIAAVGSTGDADPGAPHLHFEIHRMAPGERWWQGTEINPYPVLARK